MSRSRPSSPRAVNGSSSSHQPRLAGPSGASNIEPLHISMNSVRPYSIDDPDDQQHDLSYLRDSSEEFRQHDGPFSAPPSSTPSQLPDRSTPLPSRASTAPSPREQDHRADYMSLHNGPSSSAHGHSVGGGSPPMPLFAQAGSRTGTPPRDGPDESALLAPLPSSTISGHSSGTSQSSQSIGSQLCYGCQKPMTGQFVRALGTVYHLDCFRCRDCNTVVASKFFPIEGPDGRQHPLCERDYFSRLNLICGKCDQALRGSYITACSKKFHVEHFTCSVCPTLFGPQDSYYEHNNDVYCHYHYSTRFATKCVGCNSAILKQFVEINRNSRDECWHPECYMINKFWNIKVVSRISGIDQALPDDAPLYEAEERIETPTTLRDRQQKMEQQVYRIWTHLSAFEESSAACISDMLRHVSNGQYLDAIRMAEKFILHVEVLFAAIDDLEAHFARADSRGMSHVREARMLCRKTVDLFTLLSHTGETGTTRRMGMTQELLALVTGLAHYLKILIRIALTGALKLEREYGDRDAIIEFLDKLQGLAIGGANPSARRMVQTSRPREVGGTRDTSSVSGTEGVSYGYRSLAPESAGESPFVGRTNGPNGTNGTMSTPPSDLCVLCQKTVEEDCVRLGTYNRWHSQCVKCLTCGRVATPITKDPPPSKLGEDKDAKSSSTPRRQPPLVHDFLFETDALPGEIEKQLPKAVFCLDHIRSGCRPGFSAVSRLEQYAFLLNVALRRLYLLLLRRGVMPLASVAPNASPPPDNHGANSSSASFRDSNDIMRMKSVHLDRKLSATARLPKRSTIVESPSGRIAQPTDVQHAHRGSYMPTAGPSGSSTSPSSGSRQPPPQARSASGGSTARPAPANDASRASPGRRSNTILRPSFARNNTNVQIVDDFHADDDGSTLRGDRDTLGAASTVDGDRRSEHFGDVGDEGLTLGDIPQLLESEQAREQHRSLPRQGTKPLVAELTPLELFIVKHFAVLALHRSPLRDQFDLDEILELLEIKKSTFWNKLFKGNEKKNIKKKGVFGIPLELLVDRDGADSLLGASRTTLRIPSFIDDVISAMKQMDMSVEGIFRKNGNIRRLKELTDNIDRDPGSVDLSSDNPVQLAALLKKFLRDLPDPLLTFKLHKLFIVSQSLPTDAERRRFLHLVSLILPKTHRDTMEALFVFLKWVASFSHVDEETGSKMDLQNLATVVCPSILYAKGRDVARDESFMAIRVVTLLLEHQDEIYAVPDEFLSVLHDQEYFAACLDMPCRDVLKKCDTYLRVKQGRPPPSGSGFNVSSSAAGFGGAGAAVVGSSNGTEPRPVHQQRSDPMLRGRPTPPYAMEGRPQGPKRAGRSTSRGPTPLPPPSGPGGQAKSHSAHGHGSSPNLTTTASDVAWAPPGSPPMKSRPTMPSPVVSHSNANTSNNGVNGNGGGLPPPPRPVRMPSLDSHLPPQRPEQWDPPSRPTSVYSRASGEYSRFAPNGVGDRPHSPAVQRT